MKGGGLSFSFALEEEGIWDVGLRGGCAEGLVGREGGASVRP